MEKHTDLKELLLVFLEVYFDRCVNDNEDEEIVLNEFIANNRVYDRYSKERTKQN